jgi:hypothetical protein
MPPLSASEQELDFLADVVVDSILEQTVDPVASEAGLGRTQQRIAKEIGAHES